MGEGWTRAGEGGGVTRADAGERRETARFRALEAPGLLFDVAATSPACAEEPAPPLWPFLLPCSDSVGGNVFLGLAYGYLLLTAAQVISEGSELLLELLGPGVVGGLVLPALGAAPDTLIILASGLRGTPEQAQDEVAVGLGVLVGSTVLLVTAAWGGCMFAGACDLDDETGRAKDRTLTRSPVSDFATTGVTTDEQTPVGATLMGLSCLPFLVVQLPLIDEVDFGKDGPEFALAGAVVCAVGFVAYSAYQVASPWLQEKRLEQARLELVKGRAVSRAMSLSRSWGGLRDRSGAVNEAALDRLFAAFDGDQSGFLSLSELEALIIGLEVDHGGTIPTAEEAKVWLEQFDQNDDDKISKPEFREGMTKWLDSMERASLARSAEQLAVSAGTSAVATGAGTLTMEGELFPKRSQDKMAEAQRILAIAKLEEDDEIDDAEEGEAEGGLVAVKAGALIIGGVLLVATFADPAVGAIGRFSDAAGLNPFFVAFVATPFASNASEVVSSFTFASKKRRRNISLTYSQIYGAVTMNNTLCLGVFLAVVYARGLVWDFSAEVTTNVLVVVIMAALARGRTTFPMVYAIPALALYPGSLALITYLEYSLGWH